MLRFLTLILFLTLTVKSEPLKIWISSQQDKIYYENMVKHYKANVDPKFEAVIEAFGFREMPDKLAVALKSGEGAPDICQLDEVLYGLYLQGKIPFVDLTEKIKAANLDKTILKQRLDLFSWKGRNYGLPQSVSAYVIYYRKDLFKELEIDVKDLDTWKGVEKLGKKLAADGQGLMAIDPTFFGVYLRQRGVKMFNDKGELFPDMKKATETMEWIKKLCDDGTFVKPSRGSVFDPVFFNGAVENGEVLCLPGADWFGLDMIQQFLPHQEGKWGILPLPKWEDSKLRTASFAGQGLLIPEASKKQDEAWKFIKFVMTDKKANIDRFVNGNSFPAHMPSWDEKELMAPSKYFGGQSLGKIMKELAPTIPKVEMCPQRPMAIFMLQENYFSAILYGTYTAEQAFKEMQMNLKR